MKYVDFEDLRPDQRTIVRSRYAGNGSAWVVSRAYAVTKNGAIAHERYSPRIASKVAKEKLRELQRRDVFDGGIGPEKGGLDHFRTAKFGLNKEKS